MLRKGLLYMNTLDYFPKLEADPARSDPFEGTDRITQPQHIRHFLTRTCRAERPTLFTPRVSLVPSE
jgi:hypothetical protein